MPKQHQRQRLWGGLSIACFFLASPLVLSSLSFVPPYNLAKQGVLVVLYSLFTASIKLFMEGKGSNTRDGIIVAVLYSRVCKSLKQGGVNVKAISRGNIPIPSWQFKFPPHRFNITVLF